MINEFFDKVVVVNLDHRTDRMQAMDVQLKGYGIKYERFSAISNHNGIKGLLLSMKKLFIESIEAGINNLLVLEDDSCFLLNPVLFLTEILPQLPKDYLCFHLGMNLTTQPKLISQNILLIDKAYSTHAIGYSLEAMKLILPLLEREEIVPYDIIMMNEIQPMIKSYGTYPMCATQSLSYSDIEKNVPKWGSLMAMTYSLHTKNLNHNFMATETTPCNYGHFMNGAPPQVDPKILEIQHPELIGKPCDCKKCTYFELQCSCPGTPEWRIEWRENINR